MRTSHARSIAIIIFLIAVLAGCAYETKSSTAYAQEYATDARVNFFYGSLQPHGRWFQHRNYGWVWSPYDVSTDWRPYTQGYWVLSDYGWTWVSYEPWGWACYHYGRWFYDPQYGWCWYPDTVWAPAWVFWSNGGEWIGWAPLPPQATWTVTIGLYFNDTYAHSYVPQFGYCFVRRSHFFEHDLHNQIEHHSHNARLINETTIVVNNIRLVNNQVVNASPDKGRYEKEFKDKIRHYKLSDAGVAGPERIEGEQIKIYRPKVTQQPTAASPHNIQKPSTTRERASSVKQPAIEQQEIKQQPIQQNTIVPRSDLQKPSTTREKVSSVQQPVTQRVMPKHEPAIEHKIQEQEHGKTNTSVPVQQRKDMQEPNNQHKVETPVLEQKKAVDKQPVKQIHGREIKAPAQKVTPKVIEKQQQKVLKGSKVETEQVSQEQNPQQQGAVTQGSEQGSPKKHSNVSQDQKRSDREDRQQ